LSIWAKLWAHFKHLRSWVFFLSMRLLEVWAWDIMVPNYGIAIRRL
jgi:hypothetical protein